MPKAAPPGKDDDERGERIAKVIARAGVCSRRDAEKLIAEGRIGLNGERVTSPALNVSADALITFDGVPIPTAMPTRLWRYHKPSGLVTSHRDPEGRSNRLPLAFAAASAARDVRRTPRHQFRRIAASDQ